MNTNLELLAELTRKPAAVQWFRGLFRRVHLHVTDTGEQFTVVHHGDRVEVTPGLGSDSPNFIAPVTTENIRNLAGFFDDDGITPYEEYRIVKFMLQPCLKAALAMPILRNDALRRILNLDTHWQECLLDPEGNEDEQLTVIFVNNQWLVIPGYYGNPQRRLRLTPLQVLDYQRRLFETDEKGGLGAWLDLAKWYVKWREGVAAA
jgi:hypothetical protein